LVLPVGVGLELAPEDAPVLLVGGVDEEHVVLDALEHDLRQLLGLRQHGGYAARLEVGLHLGAAHVRPRQRREHAAGPDLGSLITEIAIEALHEAKPGVLRRRAGGLADAESPACHHCDLASNVFHDTNSPRSSHRLPAGSQQMTIRRPSNSRTSELTPAASSRPSMAGRSLPSSTATWARAAGRW